MSLIVKAAQFAAAQHANQFRKYTNRPYITHPCRVAGRVAVHPLATEELVAAAFLHDVVEDCDITPAHIWEEFGERVENYVTWMTNTSKSSDRPRCIRKLMDRDRIADAPIEIKVLKLIDRIDNLREIDPGDDFASLYVLESTQLVDRIGDADPELADELRKCCANIIGAKLPIGT